MGFRNAYEDREFASAYARLQFPGTYYLAYRDLPRLVRDHAPGRTALDFGCGAGRSTRFLREHGFSVVGVDIAADMVAHAREVDPGGDYRVMPNGDLGAFAGGTFDLVLSAFTFDNVPTMAAKVRLFGELARVLAASGRFINLVSSPEIYVHEWASFSTADFPENARARSGDIVRIINTAIDDRRPVEDVLWTDASYREVYEQAGLDVIDVHRPLATADEPYGWVNETRIAPWTIYVLGRTDGLRPAPRPSGVND